MGCDIHIFAEVRNSAGVWEKVGKVFDSVYYRPEEPVKTLSDGYIWNDPKTDEPYERRNYTLFAILADVRNGYRFASKSTKTEVFPLFKGRGVPEDGSVEYLQIVADWDIDGHHHSYASLAELQQVDWADIYVSDGGYVPVAEYERIRGTSELPEYWCGDTSATKLTVEAYEANYRNQLEASGQLEELGKDKIFSSIYIKMIWVESLMRSVDSFVEETIPRLAQLGSPEDVRVVFFFDN